MTWRSHNNERLPPICRWFTTSAVLDSSRSRLQREISHDLDLGTVALSLFTKVDSYWTAKTFRLGQVFTHTVPRVQYSTAYIRSAYLLVGG